MEVAPSLGYTWGAWEQNVIEFKKDWFILSFSAKWLGEKEVISYSLPDFPLYKRDKTNDREIVKKLWELFDKAEVLVAHNGDSYDQKKSFARFLIHNLPPPSPYKTIDTLKLARRYCKFDSNRLDDLARQLKLGRKVIHTGKDLWFKCMAGDLKAWKMMVRYNKMDVILLEKLYLKLRPFVQNHPHYVGYKTCHNCGSPRVIKRGFDRLVGFRKQRYCCQSCGAFSREKI